MAWSSWRWGTNADGAQTAPETDAPRADPAHEPAMPHAPGLVPESDPDAVLSRVAAMLDGTEPDRTAAPEPGEAIAGWPEAPTPPAAQASSQPDGAGTGGTGPKAAPHAGTDDAAAEDATPPATATLDEALPASPIAAAAAPAQVADVILHPRFMDRAAPKVTPAPLPDTSAGRSEPIPDADGLEAALREGLRRAALPAGPGGAAQHPDVPTHPKGLRLPRPAFSGASLQAVLRALGPAPRDRAEAAAELAAVPLVLLALYLGGATALAALAFVVLLAAVGADARRGEPARAPSHPAHALALAAGLAAVLGAALHALTGATAAGLSGWFVSAIAAGLWIGQVAVPRASALATQRTQEGFARARLTGTLMLSALGFGHRASALRLVAPRVAATSDDPATAEGGESLWAFLPRSAAQSFAAGFAMERALTRPALGRHAARVHAYVLCLGGYALLCILAASAFGAGGLLVLLALSALAQAQTHAADYLRRYGLARRTPPARRPLAPGPELSWDAPRAFAAAAASRTRAGAPCYPWPWPAMALAALVPPLWRRLTDPALLRLAAARRTAAPAAAPRPVPARAPRAARPPRTERTRA